MGALPSFADEEIENVTGVEPAGALVQILVDVEAILTAGNKEELIVRVLLAFAVPQEPPPLVSVNVTVAGAEAEAVYVARFGVAPPLLAKVPAAAPDKPSDHTALVAPPLNDPPNVAVVPPWQIAVTAPPTFTAGVGFIVTVLFAEVVPHEPPLVVNVRVTEAGADVDAV